MANALAVEYVLGKVFYTISQHFNFKDSKDKSFYDIKLKKYLKFISLSDKELEAYVYEISKLNEVHYFYNSLDLFSIKEFDLTFWFSNLQAINLSQFFETIKYLVKSPYIIDPKATTKSIVLTENDSIKKCGLEDENYYLDYLDRFSLARRRDNMLL